jgi:phosphoribosylformylglycinamidine synthase subunit PurQ / glutaminase
MKKRKPKSLVLFGNGINCEYETAYANRLAGFDVDLIHLNTLMESPGKIHNYSFLNLPGGFLDGDDLGSAKAQAVKWRHQKGSHSDKRFVDELIRFVAQGNIILGICNGFQLLVKTGLLPGLKGDYLRQTVTLTFNDSGRFEDRWVHLRANGLSNCIFTKGITKMYLPVRHGEGKLVADGRDTLAGMEQEGHIVIQYADEEGAVTSRYPHNPNGASLGIAGLCDPTGRILGLMPHPEAYVHYTQHPRWTREKLSEDGDGIRIFHNAFQYVVENQ